MSKDTSKEAKPPILPELSNNREKSRGLPELDVPMKRPRIEVRVDKDPLLKNLPENTEEAHSHQPLIEKISEFTPKELGNLAGLDALPFNKRKPKLEDISYAPKTQTHTKPQVSKPIHPPRPVERSPITQASQTEAEKQTETPRQPALVEAKNDPEPQKPPETSPSPPAPTPVATPVPDIPEEEPKPKEEPLPAVQPAPAPTPAPPIKPHPEEPQK